MDFGKIIAITGLVFVVLTLIFNFIREPLHTPGDIYIDKVGIKFYIPVLSTIIISVILTFFLSMLPK